MVYSQTFLKVVDNSGAKKAQCIEIYKKPFATVGDRVLVSIKKIRKTRKKRKINIEKSDKFKAVIVRTKKQFKNRINSFVSFYDNAVIVLNNKNSPLGTKILGPVPLILRRKKLLKLVLMASFVI